MRKLSIVTLLVVAVAALHAAQDTSLTEREVRDPKQLETWLESNASDAQTRVAAIEAGTATVTLDTDKIWVGNDSSNQTAMAVQGDVTITQDGTNVTAAIASEVVVNADIATNAAIASSKLASDVVATDTTNLLTEGYFDVANTTQLVFIASGVTNVIDSDITTQ